MFTISYAAIVAALGLAVPQLSYYHANLQDCTVEHFSSPVSGSGPSVDYTLLSSRLGTERLDDHVIPANCYVAPENNPDVRGFDESPS